MSNIGSGGPAFPSGLGPLENDHMIQTGNFQWHHPGMTLRDYFAAKAMQAEYHSLERLDQFPLCAQGAYRMADAMIEARK